MATRVTASRFVGRSAQLAELEAAWRDTVAGRPSLAFIAGESGVGKSRLLTELEHRAAAQGARVLGGECVKLGEGELPYAPLVAVLRDLARIEDPVLAALPAHVRGELAALVPALGSAPAAGDQSRLFEALWTLLEALAQDRPTILAIEDLHWADRSTRAFLTFLNATMCRDRLLLVATYRSDEVHRRHPLRPLLAELERDQRARRIELEPLSRAELAEQLTDILGSAPSDDLADRLFQRSEGNPLFTEELLAAGLDGRGSLPPSLRDALMVRIDRLAGDAQEVLRVLAVGQRLDHETLAAVAGLESRALRDALREAVGTHIVVAQADGTYAFRHALLREVLHDDLLPGERAELHLALARTLGAQDGTGAYPAAAVAHHYAAAGDQPAALAASVAAGDAASRVHAYAEQAAQYERVIELWDRVPDAETRTGIDLVTALRSAAWGHFSSGSTARAEALLHRALELVDETADPRRAATLLEGLHRAEWNLNKQGEALASLERGLDLVREDPAAAQERAMLWAGQAKLLMLQSRYRRSVEVARCALTETDDVAVEIRALNALGVSLMSLGEDDEGSAALERALQLALDHDRPQEVCSAAVNLADAWHLRGRSTAAMEVARRGQRLASELGRIDGWLTLLLGEIAFDTGDWELARASLLPGDRRLDVTTELNFVIRQTELALGVGDLEAARPLAERMRELARDSREPQFIGVGGALRAELARRQGDLEAAREVVDEALDRMEFCSEDVMRIARVAAVGVKVEADAAQRARDVADPQAEATALARAEALAVRSHAAADADRPVEAAYAATTDAELARARGAHEDALSRWRAAAAAWDAVGRPYLATQLRVRLAESLVAVGDRDAASTVVATARAAAAELGSRWLLDELDGLAARARLRTHVEAPAPAGDGAAPDDEPAADDEDPFGLTPRERQVLALVAAGRTNREIGAALFMAEKTASVHVSRILAKLDVRSRTEAAAVAHRLGLDAAPVA